MKSIRTKMLVYLGSLFVAVCAGLGIMSYITASNALISDVEEALPQMAKEGAQIVESRIEGELNVLEAIASMNRIKDANIPWDEKKGILNDEAKKMGYLRIGIADKNGSVTYNDDTALDIKDKEHFKKAISGSGAVSDPIVNKDDNSITIAFAVPIKVNNDVVGALVAVKDGNELSNIVSAITFKNTGKAFMINKSGAIIAHTNKDYVMNMINFIEESKKDLSLKALGEMITQMTQGKTGTYEYTLEGVVKYGGFAPIKSTGWSIGVTGQKAEVLAGLDSLRISAIVWSIVVLLIGILVIFIISQSITSTLAVAVKHLNAIASGDLTMEMPLKFLKQKDEMGSITKCVKAMQESMRNMIYAVQRSSKNIDTQSENLSSVAAELSASSENVAAAIQDVAKGAGSQAEDLMKITGILNQFAEEIESIVKSIKDVDIRARDINSMAEDSNDNMKLLVQSVNNVSEAFRGFVSKISGFGEGVKQINDITNLINSVAEQTNLLALNAAIEAARAGEAGRGFAVVADEIRKLSEETRVSSDNINKLIGDISKDTDNMIETTAMMEKELNSEMGVINTVIDSFKGIIKAIGEIVPRIESINTSAVNIDNEKTNILEKIEGVSSISEEVSASSEEIAASSEEMNASAEEVSSSAEILTNMTKDMLKEVNRFRL